MSVTQLPTDIASAVLRVDAVVDLPSAANGAVEGDIRYVNADDTVYVFDGTTWNAISAGTGTVVGPGSSTDNAVARFDGTTGTAIQNSVVTISDTGDISTPGIIESTAGGFKFPDATIQTTAATTPTGAANTFAAFDGAGILGDAPSWTFDPTRFYGIDVSQTVVPTDLDGTPSLNSYIVALNPTADVTTNSTWNVENREINLGEDDSGFDTYGTRGLNITVNSRKKSDWNFIEPIRVNSQIGNGVDAQTGSYYAGLTVAPTVDTLSTVADMRGVTIAANAFAPSTMGSFFAFRDDSTFDTLANYNGLFLNPQTVHVTGQVFGVTMGGNHTDIDGGYLGFWSNPNVTNIDNQFQSFAAGGQIVTGTNVNNYMESTLVTGSLSGAYNSVNLSPNITTIANNYEGVKVQPTVVTTSGFEGVHVNGNIGTTTGYNAAFHDSTAITTSVDYYDGLAISPSITLLTDGFNGVNISPTVVGDGTGYANGISVNMQNATNFGTGNVRAIQAIGNVEFNGIVNGYTTEALVDNGGNPTPVHALNVDFTAAAATTTANADRFGFGPIMSLTMAAGATATSGGFGIGQAALGMINLLQLDTGASTDNVTGSFVAMVAPSGDGHIDNITGYRAIAANLGSTTTVDNFYGFKFDLPAGPWATNSWAFYNAEPTAYSYLAGSLKVGNGSDIPVSLVDIDGSADTVQLKVKGHSTQTNDLVVFEQDSGADLLSLNVTDGLRLFDSAAAERFRLNLSTLSVGIGTDAASSAATQTTAVGFNALQGVTGTQNTAVGYLAGDTVTSGTKNTFVGRAADGVASNTQEAVAIGQSAFASNNSVVAGNVAASGTGVQNTVIGAASGRNAATGANNAIVGALSGTGLTSGRRNTIVGSLAGAILTSGEYNIVLGYLADVPATVSNTAVIGYYGMTDFVLGTDNGTDPFSSSTPARILRSGNAHGTDQAAGALTIQGSRSTGTGTGGDIVFKTAPAAASTSSALNTAAEVMRVTAGTSPGTGAVGVGTASPTSTLETGGSFASKYKTKSADYTLDGTDCRIGVDATAALTTMTLPTAVGITGREYGIIKIDASVNGVSITPDGAETINGAPSYTLSVQWEAVTLVSDGSGWLLF